MDNIETINQFGKGPARSDFVAARSGTASDNLISDKERAFSDIKDKTKKLTGALYRVTDLMSDREPLKWTLRNKGVSLYDNITSFDSIKDKNATINEIMDSLAQIVSVLDLCANGTNSISVLNFEILKREYENLRFFIEGKKDILATEPLLLAEIADLGDFEELGSGSNNLKDNMFNAQQERADNVILETFSLSVPEESTISENENLSIQEQLDVLNEEYKKSHSQIENNQDVQKAGSKNSVNGGDDCVQSDTESDTQGNEIKDKAEKMPAHLDSNARKSRILEFLKKNGAKTIGDIAAIFKGKMSTKTVQRDLLDLSEKGQLLAKGEKRWRTYAVSNGQSFKKKEYL